MSSYNRHVESYAESFQGMVLVLAARETMVSRERNGGESREKESLDNLPICARWLAHCVTARRLI